MLTDFLSVCVRPDRSIIEIIDVINNGQIKAAIITDDDNKLLGLVSDGDIRRALLKGINLEEAVEIIMNKTPTTLKVGYTAQQVRNIFDAANISQIPIVNENNCLIGVEVAAGNVKKKRIENPIVIMAGGYGKRLMPLTQFIPKPMVSVCGTPLLEIMLQNFRNLGFCNFYISVKYKKDVIKEYFGNGTKMGVSINYIEEDEPLGTAGALSLLPEKPTLPFIVINGDILTNMNFENLIDFHNQHQAIATMGVYKYSYQIPYGVVKYQDSVLKEIVEKPTETFFVNGGIYCLSPEALEFLSKNEAVNMTDLFTHYSQEIDAKTVIYPIHEYWQDIGHSGDLEKAQTDYPKHFTGLK